jgi:exodeoxyribonuclease VII large subunit
VTIADYVADFRALTPSEAGERCVPDAGEMRVRLDHVGHRLTRLLERECERARLRVDRLSETLSRLGQERMQTARATLDSYADRARCAMQAQIDERRHALGRVTAQLDALSPLSVLSRGYSLTLMDDGTTVVRAAADCRPGDRTRTRLGSGMLVSRVEEVL